MADIDAEDILVTSPSGVRRAKRAPPKIMFEKPAVVPPLVVPPQPFVSPRPKAAPPQPPPERERILSPRGESFVASPKKQVKTPGRQVSPKGRSETVHAVLVPLKPQRNSGELRPGMAPAKAKAALQVPSIGGAPKAAKTIEKKLSAKPEKVRLLDELLEQEIITQEEYDIRYQDVMATLSVSVPPPPQPKAVAALMAQNNNKKPLRQRRSTAGSRVSWTGRV